MYFVFPWRPSLKYFSRILHVKHIAILMSIWVVVPLVSTRWKSFCIILRNRKYPNTSNNVMHLTGAVMFVITAVRMPDSPSQRYCYDFFMPFSCYSSLRMWWQENQFSERQRLKVVQHRFAEHQFFDARAAQSFHLQSHYQLSLSAFLLISAVFCGHNSVP